MVYTLSLALRDSLAELLKVRKARIAAEELEKARIEDEVSIVHAISGAEQSSHDILTRSCPVFA